MRVRWVPLYVETRDKRTFSVTTVVFRIGPLVVSSTQLLPAIYAMVVIAIHQLAFAFWQLPLNIPYPTSFLHDSYWYIACILCRIYTYWHYVRMIYQTSICDIRYRGEVLHMVSNVFCLPSPVVLLFCLCIVRIHVDRKRNLSFIEIVSISFFLFIGAVSKSIPTSISNTFHSSSTRFPYLSFGERDIQFALVHNAVRTYQVYFWVLVCCH